jgi:hypothetical protein
MSEPEHVTFRDRIRGAIAAHGGITALALYVGDRGLPAAPVVGPHSAVPPPLPKIRRVHPVFKQKQRR